MVKALNTFASLQAYAILKIYIKVSKSGVLRKAVLIYDGGKKYIDKNRGKKDTSGRKTNCSFDAITILKQEK